MSPSDDSGWPWAGPVPFFTDGFLASASATAGTATVYVDNTLHVYSHEPESGYHLGAAYDFDAHFVSFQPVAWPTPGSRDGVLGAAFLGAEILVIVFALLAWLHLRVEIRPLLRRA